VVINRGLMWADTDVSEKCVAAIFRMHVQRTTRDVHSEEHILRRFLDVIFYIPVVLYRSVLWPVVVGISDTYTSVDVTYRTNLMFVANLIFAV
jgi:hypothetical protein